MKVADCGVTVCLEDSRYDAVDADTKQDSQAGETFTAKLLYSRLPETHQRRHADKSTPMGLL